MAPTTTLLSGRLYMAALSRMCIQSPQHSQQCESAACGHCERVSRGVCRVCGMKCIFGGSACSRLQFTSSSWLGHREPSSVTTFTDRVCSTCGKSDFYHLKKQKIHVHFYHFKFNLPHFYRTPTLWPSQTSPQGRGADGPAHRPFRRWLRHKRSRQEVQALSAASSGDR